MTENQRLQTNYGARLLRINNALDFLNDLLKKAPHHSERADLFLISLVETERERVKNATLREAVETFKTDIHKYPYAWLLDALLDCANAHLSKLTEAPERIMFDCESESADVNITTGETIRQVPKSKPEPDPCLSCPRKALNL
jgi:hypothetical protein